LLDQITILKSGEAIAVGSAFNVPTRVQIQLPNPEPTSKSSRPYLDWRFASPKFDLIDALATWDVATSERDVVAQEAEAIAVATNKVEAEANDIASKAVAKDDDGEKSRSRTRIRPKKG
jgi:hypothetical protein